MIRWIRVVIHPGWIVGIFLIPYLLLEGFFYQLIHQGIIAPELMPQGFAVTRLAILCSAPLFYGMFRVMRSHPFTNANYLKWLESTPWNSTLPLPLGPVLPVWQDLAVLSLPTVLMFRYTNWAPVIIPTIFATSYALALCLTFFHDDLRPFLYSVLFGFGGMIIAYQEELYWLVPVVAFGVFGIARVGLKRTLQSLQRWGLRLQEKRQRFEISYSEGQRTVKTSNRDLFSPLGRMKPSVEDSFLGRGEYLVISLLSGWWAFVLSSAGDEAWPVILSLAAFVLVLFRAGIYMSGYAPPISWKGRLLTRHWIIPKYDQVFLAPLCIILIAVALPLSLFGAGLASRVVYPVTLAAMFAAALQVGPSYIKWTLTGHHRIVPRVDARTQTQ